MMLWRWLWAFVRACDWDAADLTKGALPDQAVDRWAQDRQRVRDGLTPPGIARLHAITHCPQPVHALCEEFELLVTKFGGRVEPHLQISLTLHEAAAMTELLLKSGFIHGFTPSQSLEGLAIYQRWQRLRMLVGPGA